MSEGKVAKKRPEPTFGEIFLSRTVTVKIGPDLKEYQVHKTLLMHYSGFFRGAFESGNFKEGSSGEITLEDVEPIIFEAFVYWLYAQNLEKYKNWDTCSDEIVKWEGYHDDDCDRFITRLYVLADRLIAPQLSKLALEKAFIYFNTMHVLHSNVAFAFGNLPKNDPFLQLLVDDRCTTGGYGPLHDVDDEPLPVEFLYRVIDKLTESVPLKELNLGDYLKHDNTSKY